MRTSIALGILAVGSIGMAGCFGVGGSGGGSNKMQLAFSNCAGCQLSDPLASGGARIALHFDGKLGSVHGSDAGVATFSVDKTSGMDIDVVTGHAGTVTLDVLDTSGAVLMRQTFTVVDPVDLHVDSGWKTPVPLMLADTPFFFGVDARDGKGNDLRGHGEVRFTLGGTLASAEIPVGYGDGIGLQGTAGTGTLTYSVGSLTRTQSFQFLTPADITGLTATVAPTDSASGVAVVAIDAESAQGGVYTDGCVWTVSDPSVTLQGVVGPGINFGPGELGIFNLTKPGSFMVTCAAAGRTASVMISR